MSLRGQLLAVLAVLFSLLLLVLLVASVSGTRRYLEQQLASHAQDAATALSIPLAQSLGRGDRVLAEAQVASVFDRGYFKRIDVLSVDRAPLVTRTLPEKIEGVPTWFTRLLPIETPQGEAHVAAGWRQLGKVLVESQPTFAYQYLWRSASEMALWVVGIFVAAFASLRLLLGGVLKPLQLIEGSAIAVQEKRFGQIPLTPRAPELARVVAAMNSMSRRVAEMLDEETARADALRRQAYEDELTGLANRRGFELRLGELLEGEHKFELAAVVAVEFDGMRTYTRAHGFAAGLALMRSLADAAAEVFAGPWRTLFGHTNEHSFSFVLAGIDAAQAAGLAGRLRHRLAETLAAVASGDRPTFAMGLAYFRQTDKRSDVFARADLAVETARQRSRDQLAVLPDAGDQPSTLGSFGWRQLIQNALKENRWRLVSQPVVSLAQRGQQLHGELMARLVDADGRLVPAAQFLPMAVRHDLMPDIDRGLVALAIDYLSAQGDPDSRIAINLSPQSAADPGFVDWLGVRLAGLKDEARRLLIEISEFGCLADTEAARRVMDLARRHGARFGIDHFGLDPRALQLMRAMPPDYVKLNGGLVGAAAEDAQARAVVESVVRLAHSLEVQVIAQNVENEAQVGVLLAVAVDGGQGYLFGAPS